MILFSVIIPAYNYAHVLERALASVLPQLKPGDEVIVVDDGSQDTTRQQLLPYLGQYPEQVQYYYQPHSGPGAARNYGAAMAKGDYFLFLDADDELLPEALEDYRAALSEPTEILMLGARYVSADGRVKDTFPAPLSDRRARNFKR